MVDMRTSYMGLTLNNPLVASASPLCERMNAIRLMEDSGIAAIVLPSLFEEQINQESIRLHHGMVQGEEHYAEALNYFPEMSEYNLGPEPYLRTIEDAKRAVDIPVIASLNGVSEGGWIDFAKLIEQAGADGLELNLYDLPVDPDKSGQEVEAGYLRLVKAVRGAVGLPLAIKLSPFFSSIPHMARQLDMAGADALVLFNRFYQPDLDVVNLEIVPSLDLSRSAELRPRLQWTGILFGSLNADIAITGGVHSAEDVLKCLMSGASVAMTTSALLKNGVGHIREILSHTRDWLDEFEYTSTDQIRGCLSRRNAAGPELFERGNYMKVLSSYPAPSLDG